MILSKDVLFLLGVLSIQLAVISGGASYSYLTTPNVFPYSPYYYHLQRNFLPNRLSYYSYYSSPSSDFSQRLILLPAADPAPADATCGTCGQNAHCATIGGRPVCSCLRGYSGDPVSICHRVECLDSTECGGHLVCLNSRCVDPCEGVCGTDAECRVNAHVPICTCPEGYTGDPFTHCRRFNPEELCHPSPCGPNTRCEVVSNIPTCKCLAGYHGSPLQGCRHECDHDNDCGGQQACIEFRCQNPCSACGKNAECTVRNHAAICTCPKNYHGNALSGCHPECTVNSECPGSRPACFYNKCVNPCDGVCGINANCELRSGVNPVCSCPKDMTGDPFVRCRPFEKKDLCEPNPCGTNARCTPGYDRTHNERPVCTCPEGYTGDPIRSCIPAECTMDDDCPDNKACNNYNCVNPCGGQCGAGGICNARRHVAVCTCQEGYAGDALNNCYDTKVDPPRAGRYFRHRYYNNY